MKIDWLIDWLIDTAVSYFESSSQVKYDRELQEGAVWPVNTVSLVEGGGLNMWALLLARAQAIRFPSPAD